MPFIEPPCRHLVPGRPDYLYQYLARAIGGRAEDLSVLPCRDVHAMARMMMRARYLSVADWNLLDLQSTSHPADRPFTRASLVTAYILATLTALSLVLFGAWLVVVIV